MVRSAALVPGSLTCVPHSRGDGPQCGTSAGFADVCSPLAWGWSEVKFCDHRYLEVFPTRVGMVRDPGRGIPRMNCVPHSRGDGPKTTGVRTSAAECSPLAWGWSEDARDIGLRIFVFPTRVGMVRHHVRRARGRGRVPHSRGDGPFFRRFCRFCRVCSPLAWGWSGPLAEVERSRAVFPTRVGMVRCRA